MPGQDTLEVKAEEIIKNVDSAITSYIRRRRQKSPKTFIASLKLINLLLKEGALKDMSRKGYRLKNHPEIALQTYAPTSGLQSGENVGVTADTEYLLTLARTGFCGRERDFAHYNVGLPSNTFTQLLL